jgi:hypothetical protein
LKLNHIASLLSHSICVEETELDIANTATNALMAMTTIVRGLTLALEHLITGKVYENVVDGVLMTGGHCRSYFVLVFLATVNLLCYAAAAVYLITAIAYNRADTSEILRSSSTTLLLTTAPVVVSLFNGNQTGPLVMVSIFLALALFGFGNVAYLLAFHIRLGKGRSYSFDYLLIPF